MPRGASPPSVMSRSSWSSFRSTSSRVFRVSPGRCAAHLDRAAERVDVVGVQRLSEREHDVVRHVDGQRDRPHPHLRQPPLHPRRGRPGRVDAADDPRDEPVAADLPVDRRRVGEPDRIPVLGGLGHGEQRGVAEAAAGGSLRVPVLAGQAAHREAVAAVRRDVDLDDLLAEPQQSDGVVADLDAVELLRRQQPGQHDDPGVVVADAELVLGADHPVGHPAVGPAGGDLEPAGQDGAGQHDDDEVADLEVRGPADDLLVLPLGLHLAVRPDVDDAVADGLAVLLDLLVDGEHAADDDRTGEVAAVDRLLLQADRHERLGDVGARGARGEVGVLAQPAQRCAHLRPPSRTARRTGRRPRRCRACRSRRGAAAARVRCPARTRTRCRRPGRCRRRAIPCG